MGFTYSSSSLNFTRAQENIPGLLHGVQTQLQQNDSDADLQLLLNACGSAQLFPSPASGTSKYTARKCLVMKQSYQQDSWWSSMRPVQDECWRRVSSYWETKKLSCLLEAWVFWLFCSLIQFPVKWKQYLAKTEQDFHGPTIKYLICLCSPKLKQNQNRTKCS